MAANVYPCGAIDPHRMPGNGPRWQYLRLQVSTSEIVNSDVIMGQLGADGWELTGTAPNDAFVHLWFKRQV